MTMLHPITALEDDNCSCWSGGDAYVILLDAQQLAELEEITLTDTHWRVIKLLRSYYARTDIAPAMRPLVKLVKTEFGQEIGSSAFLMGLFGGSPAKVAAKISGLPRPTNCI